MAPTFHSQYEIGTLDETSSEVLCMTKPKRRALRSFEEWSTCFTTFMGYRGHCHPDQYSGMISYLRFVADKAQFYTLSSILDYDTHFRTFLANYVEQDWQDPVPHLERQFFHSGSARPTCFRCNRSDHLANACPTTPRGTSPSFTSTRTAPYNAGNKRSTGTHQNPPNTPIGDPNASICRNFQSGRCAPPCPRSLAHVCATCFKPGHARFEHVDMPPRNQTHWSPSGSAPGYARNELPAHQLQTLQNQPFRAPYNKQ